MFQLRKLLRIKNYTTAFRRNKYIVLLPEVPSDTAENNSLLRYDSLPTFTDVTTEKCFNAIGKLVVAYESEIDKLDQKLHDAEIPKNVQNVILPLDRLSGPLDFAWGTFKILYTVLNSESLSKMFVKLYPRVAKAKRERYLNGSIYRAFKELNVDKSMYTEPVKRIILKYLLEAQLSGMELSEDAYRIFQNIIIKVDEHRTKYNSNLMHSTAVFSHDLEFNDVKDFPRDVLQLVASDPLNPTNGPWKLKLEPHIYRLFMEHCDNKMQRWNAWFAYNSRAISAGDQKMSNGIEIEEIRFQRTELAKVLGFTNFAEMSMKTKMAGSIENVTNMITTLHIKSKVATLREIQDLQAFANKSGYEHKLELWDIPYWQRLHKEELFRIDEALVRNYFPLPAVLNSVFNLFHKLFRITTKECTSDVDVWHKDVSFYRVYDENSKEIASFFMDPFVRKEKKMRGAWMEVGRNRSDVSGIAPLSYLIFNFFPPIFGKPSLLSFEDVKILLKKFGHCLQHSLTTVPYSEVSGLTNLEWDVVNVCPLVISSFTKHYKTIAELSCHVDTNEKIPLNLHEKLIARDGYMKGYQLNDELYLAALDMELYTKKEFWASIEKRLWTQYIPFPYEKKVSRLCSFPEIFSGSHPAAYFSNLWSEMIAADVFSAFQEVGLDNDAELKEIGKRFRDTYLALGGGHHPGEVFRQFRGRDPCIDALISSYGLKA